MANGIKLGIIATENSGKTTLVSGLQDALVVSTDNKAFTGNVPHFRYSKFEGLDAFIDTVLDKLEIYKDKMKEYPKTLVIDSVTHFTNNMEKYWNDNAKGFDIYSNLGKDILALNSFLEDEIIANGINVIFTSHCQFDKETLKYAIAAPGSFGRNGSWNSITDNSLFIEIKGNSRIVHHKTLKFPCRSNIPDMVESENMNDYDINKHVALLEANKAESDEWVL